MPLPDGCIYPDDDYWCKTDEEYVHVRTSYNYIRITKRYMNTPYGYIEEYFKTTKSLQIEGKCFYDMEIGIWKEYDENGKLISEIDYDSYFRFSLDSFIEKMKREYDVDMFSRNPIKAKRYGSETESIYQVHVRLDTEFDMYDSFLFDGNTGELLFRMELDGDNILKIEWIYLNYLNKQE